MVSPCACPSLEALFLEQCRCWNLGAGRGWICFALLCFCFAALSSSPLSTLFVLVPSSSSSSSSPSPRVGVGVGVSSAGGYLSAYQLAGLLRAEGPPAGRHRKGGTNGSRHAGRQAGRQAMRLRGDGRVAIVRHPGDPYVSGRWGGRCNGYRYLSHIS
jgi:hypothetical protein